MSIKNLHQNSGGSTLNARYCYSVWLRHLIFAYDNDNGITAVPKRIAELGPGDSLGVGISALISGADEYFAYDVIKYQPTEVNLNIFNEPIELFKNRTDIPNETEFPKLKPYLKSYNFPTKIFSQSYLDKILEENRLAKIRRSIECIYDKNQLKDKNAIN